MRKTGLSAASFGKKGEKFEINENLFAMFRENNISAIEISLPFGVDFFNLHFDKIEEYSKKYDVELWSYHLPFSDFYDPSSNDFAYGMQSFKMLIDRASVSSVKNVVIHPSTELLTDDGRDKRMQNAKRNLSELCDFANGRGIELAVENLPRLCLGNCAEEMMELVSENSRLKVCFDVNHIAIGTHADFIRKLNDRIVTVHVADYHIPDNHLMPFDGKLDWKEFITLLNEGNYQGPFLFECGRAKKDGTFYDAGIYHRLHKTIEGLN